MKTYTFPLAVVSALLLASFAVAGGADSPRASLMEAPDLGVLSVGVAWEKGERSMIGNRFGAQILETRDIFATVSLDLFPWLTVVGGWGESEIKPAPTLSYLDSNPMWLAGLRFNILEHAVTEPRFLANMLRLQGLVMMTEHEGEFIGDNVEWTETRCALTARAEVFPVQWAVDREQVPFSTEFFVGPVYSTVDGDFLPTDDDPLNANADFEEDDNVGVIYGVDVNIAGHFSAGYEGRQFNNGTHILNVVFHF